MDKKYSIVRTLYLYLFSLVGLVMLTIGGVQLVDLALKTYVFPGSDIYEYYPDRAFIPTKDGMTTITEEDFVQAMKNCTEACELSNEERASLVAWLQDYETQREIQDAMPEKNAQRERQRQASRALASIIVGMPIFFFHWRVIQQDHRNLS